MVDLSSTWKECSLERMENLLLCWGKKEKREMRMVWMRRWSSRKADNLYF